MKCYEVFCVDNIFFKVMQIDKATIQYYSENADTLASVYENATGGVVDFFQLAYPAGSRVLDVGFGSGKNMAKLLSLGYEAYGVEPCKKFKRIAAREHPELQGRLEDGSLPELDNPFGGKFDGILCSAVLMHVSKESLFDCAFSFKRLLKEGGRLLLSVPKERTRHK